ncbi:hypothetical protein TNCV_859631 [Trichonephila clavipes]|nr:hypothetical protein TNCV_859631 [Trichonephila clavipes]
MRTNANISLLPCRAVPADENFLWNKIDEKSPFNTQILKSTLEGKISRIETFIESANEKPIRLEIKAKAKSDSTAKNVEELSQQLLRHSECEKDAELTAIDEDLHLLEVRLESLEVRELKLFLIPLRNQVLGQ